MNNFRDFGYAPAVTGKLYRGAEFGELNSEDRELLFHQFGITTVVDLRSMEEREAKKDVEVAGVRNMSVPLLSVEEMSVMVEGQFPDVSASYRATVSKDKQDVWTKIFDTLLAQEEGGILFHCTQGKDRTGIVVAVILTALGVDKETIIHDYLLTNQTASMPEQYRPFAESMPAEIHKLFNALFYVNQDYLELAFEEMERQFGSVERFLTECCGLDESKMKLLRGKYAK